VVLHGGDNFAAAAEGSIAEFDHTQIGPSARTQPNDGAYRIVGRAVGMMLHQQQDRRRRRTR